MNGALKHLILTDESTWYMADGLPEIAMAKQKKDWWSGVIEGHAEIDVDVLEGEKFLDKKMMDRLRTRKAKEKANKIATRVDPLSIEEMQSFYKAERKRIMANHEKHFESRIFALWTKKARIAAGLPGSFSSLSNVCTPIRCVENLPKCTLRSKVDPSVMDNLYEQARLDTKKIYDSHIKGLDLRLGIVAATNRLSPRVYESAMLDAKPGEVWKFVFPVKKAVGINVLSSTCSVDHGVGMPFETKNKAGVVETYMLSSLSHHFRRVTWTLVDRSHPLKTSAAVHTITLRTETSSGKTFIQFESEYSKDASQEILAESHVSKLDFFDWIPSRIARLQDAKACIQHRNHVEGKNGKQETKEVLSNNDVNKINHVKKIGVHQGMDEKTIAYGKKESKRTFSKKSTSPNREQIKPTWAEDIEIIS